MGREKKREKFKKRVCVTYWQRQRKWMRRQTHVDNQTFRLT